MECDYDITIISTYPRKVMLADEMMGIETFAWLSWLLLRGSSSPLEEKTKIKKS